MRHIVWPFQVFPPAFYVSCPSLQMAHLNIRANGANFVVNSLKTHVNTLKS